MSIPNIEQLAIAAGMHRRTLERHRVAGCPWPTPGGDLEAWARDLRAWIEARSKRAAKKAQEAPPARDELERLRRANASIRELELEQKRGELLSRDVVAAEWRRRVLAVRAKLLALPKTLAGRCANAPADIVDAEAAALIRDVLDDFARGGDLTPEVA